MLTQWVVMVLNCNVLCYLQQCKCPDQDLWAPLYSAEDSNPQTSRLKNLESHVKVNYAEVLENAACIACCANSTDQRHWQATVVAVSDNMMCHSY